MIDMASVSLVFLKKYLDLAAASGSLDTSDYLARICGRQRSVKTFPDGSVQFDVQVEEASRALERLATAAASGAAMHKAVMFACKSVSENHVAVIVVPASYFDLLGSEGLVIGDVAEDAQEYHQGRSSKLVEITATFRRRLTRASIIEFSGVIRDWAETVRSAGIFGEGPATVLGSRIEFERLNARFVIDLVASGHNTLNWLIILMIDYALRGVPIQSIAFAVAPPEEGLSPSRSQRIYQVNLDHFPLVSVEIEASKVPRGLVPESTYASDRLPILTVPGFDWEKAWQSLRLAVFFSRPLHSGEQSTFRMLIDGWVTVGTFGEPGDGIRYAENVQWFDDCEYAKFWADMGGARRDAVIPLLIRMLENFDRGVAPLEAVAFGEIEL